MDINKQIDNMIEIVKTVNVLTKASFLLLKDHDGWTNGYMADLTDINLEKMKAQAILKQPERLNLDKNECPTIQSIIDKATGNHKVEKLEVNLEHKTIRLINSEISAEVNVSYLAYFQKEYKDLGGITNIILTGKDKPVKIINKDMLIGLIMPILID